MGRVNLIKPFFGTSCSVSNAKSNSESVEKVISALQSRVLLIKPGLAQNDFPPVFPSTVQYFPPNTPSVRAPQVPASLAPIGLSAALIINLSKVPPGVRSLKTLVRVSSFLAASTEQSASVYVTQHPLLSFHVKFSGMVSMILVDGRMS